MVHMLDCQRLLFAMRTSIVIFISSFFLYISSLYCQESYTYGVYQPYFYESYLIVKQQHKEYHLFVNDDDGDKYDINANGNMSIMYLSSNIDFSNRVNFAVNAAIGHGTGDWKESKQFELSYIIPGDKGLEIQYHWEDARGEARISPAGNPGERDNNLISTWWVDIESKPYLSFADSQLILAEGWIRIRRTKNVFYRDVSISGMILPTRDSAKVFDISVGGKGEVFYPFVYGPEDPRCRSGLFIETSFATALTDGSIPFMAYVDLPAVDIPIYSLEFQIAPGIRFGSGDGLRAEPETSFSVEAKYGFHGRWWGGSRIMENGTEYSFYKRKSDYGPEITLRVTF